MNIYEQAISLWGPQLQVAMFAEECSEAAASSMRYLFRNMDRAGGLASEVADVEIMCEQMRIVLGNEAVSAAKSAKLARLQSRIDRAHSGEPKE